MPNKLIAHIFIVLVACLVMPLSLAQNESDNENDDAYQVVGQTIQIHTDLQSWVGRPTLTLNIYNVDDDENIPYQFTITRGKNSWVAFTYGRNYLIAGASLNIETYNSRRNSYKSYNINNFCHLQSNGRIVRGTSMYITIKGDLTPYSNTYSCEVIRFPEHHFYIVPPEDSDP